MTSVDEIEKHIKPLLLKNISFVMDNKSLKSGKLILFSVKDFFCVFTISVAEKENKHVLYEIPYPFTLTPTTSSLEFDYTVNGFCAKNINISKAVEQLALNRTSKFFNKKLVVIPS
jgi:hypothetical protein